MFRVIPHSLGSANAKLDGASLALCVVGALLVWPSDSAAADVEVSSTTAAQGYSLRSPFGEPILSRRRFLQTLGMRVMDLGSGESDPDAPQLSFRMRMRLDADFGMEHFEVDPASNPRTFVPGLQRSPIDLMYGYFDASNLADGLLSMRLGRQYVVDPLGWWSFDGALMRVELPVYLAFETYGGFEQRGGFPLSSPRFEREGVLRGDRGRLDANVYPEFVQAHLAPAYGVVAETWGLPVAHARVAYRKVWNRGEVTTRPFPPTSTALPPTYEGYRISSERLGVSADLVVDDVGALRGGSVYDFYTSLFSSHYGSLDAFATDWLTLGADADRVVPSFDGDSIWNWFASEPTTTATGRAEVRLTEEAEVSASSGVRWVDLTNDDPASGVGHAVDWLGRLAARLRWPSTTLGLAGTLDRGERGIREGGDLYGERWFDQRYLLSGRVSLYDWEDDLRPERSAMSFGYVVGGGYRPTEETKLLVEWEHNSNRLVGQRYRVLALLQLLVNE